MDRRTALLGAAALPLLSLTTAARAAAAGTVNVLYAGSLVNLMEHGVGPAFDHAEQAKFQGYAGGSNKLANEIRGKLRQGDVFISANPDVNKDLMGPANGAWVEWYITFAESPLVIGYNASSPIAAALKTKPWYDVLRQPGVRIGRTDPKLDPKGQLTLKLFEQASRIYKLPDLSQQVLGAPENPAQVFPEENLVGRLQSGQLDVGFFYSTETADLKIPAIKLPPETTLSAHYTATILRDAPNPTGAERFIAFLIGAQGRHIMQQHGLDVVGPAVMGNAPRIPPRLRSELPPAK